MTRLSVNINKIAVLRNSRGSNLPDLLKVAADCERFGAQGITIHPRPDERHIKYSDITPLKELVTTEYNIEGYPDQRFIDMILDIKPEQCTLVPDPPGVLTSNEGWNTIEYQTFLKDIVTTIQNNGTRVSLFLNPEEHLLQGAAKTGAERIEFYTGHFANEFEQDKYKAVAPHTQASKIANQLGLGVNAGHDLNLNNLAFYKNNTENLLEVSIGHALICDALYYGLQNTIAMYLHQLK
jgi:pyridoxine 5-phosphate synthase